MLSPIFPKKFSQFGSAFWPAMSKTTSASASTSSSSTLSSSSTSSSLST